MNHMKYGHIEVNVGEGQEQEYKDAGFRECTECHCHDHAADSKSDEPVRSGARKSASRSRKSKAKADDEESNVNDPDKNRDVEAEVEQAVEQGVHAAPADPTVPGAATTRTSTKE